MADKKPAEGEPIIIKKYANRRLYNTATSSYVTLDYLAQMVKDGDEFVVNDAKSGEDITRQVLTHIIVEEESKGTNLLPISFLRHLISFYGDSLQAVVPNYLEQTMQSFATNQETLRKTMEDALGGFNPFGQFEEVSKQNMAMFENAMKMFTPFYAEGGNGAAPKAANKGEQGSGDIDDMRAKLEEMQRQLDTLSSDKK
ncbi:MAG: polyhydroxyalkanoate synthesis repressor PhaR [Rhodospirillales bacterium]